MAEQKIFVGPRVRRIRKALGLTQTAMAEGLGISPSYLNLIERNQRPLTVQLILKLASVYKVGMDDLQGEAAGDLAALREVFADPLLSGELPGDQELVELADAAPNAAAGLIKLFRAYKEQAARLSDLSEFVVQEGKAPALLGARLPLDEVNEVLERRPAWFPEIEDEAEAFVSVLGGGGTELSSALKEWLRRECGVVVRTLPAATMPNWRRRYDRHSQRLFVSERLSPFDQLREIAMEAVLIRMSVAIARGVEALKLSGDEARRIARFLVARYAAHALMMPYQPFRDAALRSRYDIDVLRSRFGVSFEQAATRLTSLQRPGASGVPFFLLETDNAGNVLRRAGAQGFPHAAFGGGCPKLAVHTAFAQPGQIFVEAAAMPDGGRFLTMARTLEGPQAAFAERPRRTALLLGCDLSHAGEIAYGDALPGAVGEGRLLPIGRACRLCERAACLSRAEPPVTRPLGLDDMATGLSAFDFQ